MSFLTEDILKGTDWRALERAIARIMIHAGWHDVTIIGGSGDEGGDIVGIRDSSNGRKVWVVQVKAITSGIYVGVAAINEVVRAMSIYHAQISALATNGEFWKSVYVRQIELDKNGFEVNIWNGRFLKELLNNLPLYCKYKQTLRDYQSIMVKKVIDKFDGGGRQALYIVATGLGKTVIAAEIANILWAKKYRKILMLCHAQELALQLEQSFWTHLPKDTPTRFFFNGIPPIIYEGINFGLYQTLYGYLSSLEPGAFDVIIVDEAHHAMALGFRTCIEHLKPKFLIGMTATPWRGDGQHISEVFGEPIGKVSLIDGMAMGYLSQVDYRLFCDNVNWEIIPKISKKKLTIRNLNKQLFLPQRDDAIISEIKKVYGEILNPKVAIFSPSIKHSHRFASMLSASGIPCVPLSGVEKIERRNRLLEFGMSDFSAITAVDVMNEGIDIPDVNILVFLRATHSRRIFVQQLGRGLRIAHDKVKVIVLDFVSDIRRIADVVEMDNEGREKGKEAEILFLKEGIVTFSDPKVQKFINAWLTDVTDLGSIAENEKLVFPEG